MNWQAWVFTLLVAVQLVGTIVFVGIYRRADWRASEVGRHLMFYSASAGGIDAAWLLIIVVKWPPLMFLLFIAQVTFGVLIWQRVRIAWRAQQSDANSEDTG